MKVLITCGGSEIAGTIAAAVGKAHKVTLTDLPTGRAGTGAATNALSHDEATDKLVSGQQAIIHIGYGGQKGDAPALLDYYGRRTYNLLFAAANAGVERCIYISTLKLLQDYDENLTVTEKWRSHPPSDDPDLLACHIGESVCKEFARDRLVKVVTLRLGWPIVSGTRAQAARSGETASLATDDLARAVNEALTANVEQWQDVHVQSPVPNQRYLLHAAEKLLSFPSRPQPVDAQAAPAARVSRKGVR